jgi:predicted permease
MTAIMHSLVREYPAVYGSSSNQGVLVEPLLTSTVRQVRRPLYVLLTAVGLLLVIGCLNLSILLIARARARGREMAVRVAVGADSKRIIRQTLAEVLPLGLLGGAGGALFSWWLLRALLQFLPADMPRVESIGLHLPVLGFSLAGGIVTVIAAGLLPARLASRTSLVDTMQAESRSVAGGGARDILVVAQVAIAVVLLFGEALFVRSLLSLLSVTPGFETRGILTMHVAVTRSKYPSDRQVGDYYDRIVERVSSIPGIIAAGFVNRLPLSGTAQSGPVQFEGRTETDLVDTDWRSVTPGYFEAIGIPLKRGRLFARSDRESSSPVGMIDEQLARKVFGRENPIGKRFRIAIGTIRGPWTEIVGVVGHVLNDTPERDVRPQVYWPETQRTQDRAALVVRTAGHPSAFTSAVVGQIRKENAEQPVYDVRSMQEWVGRSLQTRNLMTALLGLFGCASLGLACLGVYGVVSYAARMRTREFGIRMALGAQSGHVRGLVLGHAARLALAGSAIGLLLTWPVGKAVQSLLFGVTRTDVAALAAAPLLLLATVLIASTGPARRASRIAPVATLRGD